jgi:hypothetical protein
MVRRNPLGIRNIPPSNSVSAVQQDFNSLAQALQSGNLSNAQGSLCFAAAGLAAGFTQQLFQFIVLCLRNEPISQLKSERYPPERITQFFDPKSFPGARLWVGN